MVEHRGEALPGLHPLGLYEGEEGGMVEHRGEALPGLHPLGLYEAGEGGMGSTGVKHYLVLTHLACMKVRKVGWWSTGV